MLFDEKVEKLIRDTEGMSDNQDDNPNFIFDRRNLLYSLKYKFYRMPIIDLKRREVRLVETDYRGNYLHDEDGKRIKLDVPIVYFRENVHAISPF